MSKHKTNEEEVTKKEEAFAKKDAEVFGKKEEEITNNKKEITKRFKDEAFANRMVELLKELGVNANAFAKTLLYDRSQTVYDAKKAKSYPSFIFFQRFLAVDAYNHINIEWLISGNGNMKKDDNLKEKDLVIQTLQIEKKQVEEQSQDKIRQLELTLSDKMEIIDALKERIKDKDSLLEAAKKETDTYVKKISHVPNVYEHSKAIPKSTNDDLRSIPEEKKKTRPSL